MDKSGSARPLRPLGPPHLAVKAHGRPTCSWIRSPFRLTEGYEAAAPTLTRALAAVRNHDIGADDVDGLLWLVGNRAAGIVAVEAWDYETGRALAERQVRVTRESGALVQLQFALNFLANNVVLTGDLRTAAALIEEERLLSIVTRVAPPACSTSCWRHSAAMRRERYR